MSNENKPTVYTTPNLEGMKSGMKDHQYFTIYYGHLPVCQLQYQSAGVQFFHIYLDADLFQELMTMIAEILSDHQTQAPDETTSQED